VSWDKDTARRQRAFILPTLQQLATAAGVTVEIEVVGDIVRVRGSNGRETWVNKMLYLDALGAQRHNQEPGLARGLWAQLDKPGTGRLAAQTPNAQAAVLDLAGETTSLSALVTATVATGRKLLS
jgi:hypothetical protein